MKATDTLMGEHRIIERVLTALEKQARRLDAGEAVRPSFFLDTADFVRNFADGSHHDKEETHLFPAMAAHGFPPDAGPLAVMLADHEQGRRLAGAMRDAAERLEGGDTDAAPEVVRNAMGYVVMLRQHIMKEDSVLFPMAEQALPEEQKDQLAEAFADLDAADASEGVRAKYVALAEKLEAEAGTQRH